MTAKRKPFTVTGTALYVTLGGVAGALGAEFLFHSAQFSFGAAIKSNWTLILGVALGAVAGSLVRMIYIKLIAAEEDKQYRK